MAGLLIAKGLLLGFSIAAPVGPIGLLCIRRTLGGGLASGLFCGLGTALADALYGFIAAFGFSTLTAVLVERLFYLQLAGGVFLCYMGFAAFKAVPEERDNTAAGKRGMVGGCVSAFFFTLANPLTILSFGAVFAGLGLAVAGSGFWPAVSLVLGVFCGSLLWWLVLSLTVAHLRTGFDKKILLWINRVSGLVILYFGLACLWGLV